MFSYIVALSQTHSAFLSQPVSSFKVASLWFIFSLASSSVPVGQTPSFSCVDSINMSFSSSFCSPVRTIIWCWWLWNHTCCQSEFLCSMVYTLDQLLGVFFVPYLKPNCCNDSFCSVILYLVFLLNYLYSVHFYFSTSLHSLTQLVILLNMQHP